MPLDPKAKAMLDELQALNLPPLHTLPPAEARAVVLKQFAYLNLPVVPVAAVTERQIPGPGGPIPVRIYTPEGAAPFPLLVYFHGGGFVVSDLDTHDPLARALCAGAGCVVVSVHYRLAPEHKFPAAPDDCLAATRWAVEHAAELGADPARAVVCGDSAGGNLATVTALRIREEGGPALSGQLLFYPIVDYHTPATLSYLENATGYGLTREQMIWYWGQYLNDETEAINVHASPLRAPDLGGLPPALVITAEFDPLRDEAEQYAVRLQEAGVPTVLTRYNGTIHGFANRVGILEHGRQAVEEACLWLKDRWATQPE